jgi:hypothetical protein
MERVGGPSRSGGDYHAAARRPLRRRMGRKLSGPLWITSSTRARNLFNSSKAGPLRRRLGPVTGRPMSR